MALFIDNSDRLIIPSWRTFDKSLSELTPIRQYKHPVQKGEILEYVTEWKDTKNVVTAGELISAAIVNGLTEEPAVLEAAKFVVESPLKVPVALTNASKGILSIPLPPNIDPAVQFPMYVKIARLKKLLSDYPTSAVLHIEIARLYMLLGQLDIAENHIYTALYFDKNNRFVVRAAARYFIHREDDEKAVEVLQKSELTKVDPWLMASEISVSRKFEKRSPNLRRATQIIDSKNFSNFDLSELCGTIGMEELENGAFKKSRKLFNQSLTAANDNSLAQAQWVSRNRNLALAFPDAPINVHYKEALSYDKFFSGDYKSSLQYAIEWHEEVPYSLKCAMFGSGVATTYLKDYKISIQILSDYLLTNQRSKAALNDLAYAYALNNDVENAQKKLDIAAKEIDYNHLEEVDICLVATQGLVLFRRGDVEAGSRLYENAIDVSRSLPRKEMLYTAQLNYCSELLRHSNEDSNKLKVTNILNEIPDFPEGTPISILRKEVEGKLQKLA